MKLNCPYCGETFTYDRSLAGQPVECSYCEQAIKMPTVDELPAESQEELRREEAKRQQKQKRKYQRKQERYLKEIEKEEKQKAREEARQKQQELQKKAEAARQPTPEESAVGKRYRALRLVAKWNKAAAGLVLLGYLACVGLGVTAAMRGLLPWSWLLTSALVLAVPAAGMTLTVWASGELILVFLGIADDVRITRLTTQKKLARETDPPMR